MLTSLLAALVLVAAFAVRSTGAAALVVAAGVVGLAALRAMDLRGRTTRASR
jgi:hypothetical protein